MNHKQFLDLIDEEIRNDNSDKTVSKLKSIIGEYNWCVAALAKSKEPSYLLPTNVVAFIKLRHDALFRRMQNLVKI